MRSRSMSASCISIGRRTRAARISIACGSLRLLGVPLVLHGGSSIDAERSARRRSRLASARSISAAV